MPDQNVAPNTTHCTATKMPPKCLIGPSRGGCEEVAETVECVGISHVAKRFSFPHAVFLDDKCLNHPEQSVRLVEPIENPLSKFEPRRTAIILSQRKPSQS